MSAFALLLGAIVGSFLNVVIHRYPRGESIAFPPSHCPDCDAPIKPYDNVPVLSYLILRGRCRNCRTSITPRYPLVELANALFYLAAFQRTGPTIAFPLVAATISMTLVLIYIDLDIQILPDVIDLPGIAIGLAIGWLGIGAVLPSMTLSASLIDAACGAILGASTISAIILTYWLVRRVEGMGWGDAKMMAMIGAVAGWRATLAVLFLASITGAIAGVLIAVQKRSGLQLALPFGVFLGLALLAVMFFGSTLFAWYLSLLLR